MKQFFDINVFPWGRADVACTAELEFGRDGISVCMTAEESDILATVTEQNGEVYKDSCLEFFFSPCPEESRAYFNFEANPLGTLYTGFSAGGTRASSEPVEHEGVIDTRPHIDRQNGKWSVSYDIPYDFIKKYAPGFNENDLKYITGNFYKCADSKKTPHYGLSQTGIFR